MGVLQDFKRLLTDAGVGSTGAGSTGWRIVYREFQPVIGSIGAQQIALVPSGGFPEDGKPPIERPTMQVLIRGTTNASSGLEVKVDAVIDALNLKNGSIGFGNWYYADIRVQGDKISLGRDENGYPVYATNFNTVRSRTS